MRLLHVSEGWFSAVYLHLRALAEHGALPVGQGDMTALFFDAMIDPLPPQQQEFLAVMAQADEFTMPMAQAITGAAETQALLAALTVENAFVTQLPDGETYRFHHMLRDCASQAFSPPCPPGPTADLSGPLRRVVRSAGPVSARPGGIPPQRKF